MSNPKFKIDSEYRLKYKKVNSRKETIPVTVCVAAMCDGNTIIGASDRMLTSGDIQFEPQQPKIIPLTKSIFIMVAGDSSMQAEIIQNVQFDVNKRIGEDPANWWNVRDVANLYSQYYNEVRFKKAEKNILSSLGLDNNTFITRQKEMDSNLVLQITKELMNYEAPRISTIFAGIDTSGAHIYVADNENVSCLDLVGFAAIGVGSWHASSQMMFAGHTRFKSIPETLLLVYSAKKRAEVAPGVGESTDMFMVGPDLGNNIYPLGEHVFDKLKEIYKSEQDRERDAGIIAKDSIKQYVEELARGATEKNQATIPSPSPSIISGDTSADEKTSRNDHEDHKPET